MEKTDIRGSLDNLQPGTEIRVRLEDGSEVTGTYRGRDGDQVLLEDSEKPVDLGEVEMVELDVSTEGPE